MAQPFLGQITVFPYNFAPYGWLDCAGQLLPIVQYSALFSLLGTAYGGNGTTNFGLPDLQGRIPVGQGQLNGGSDYVMGEAVGAENVTLLISNMPAHSHSLSAFEGPANTNNPSGKVLAKAVKGTAQGKIYNPATPDTPLAATSVATAGASLPHNNIQPSLVLRYCIAMQGIFPTRG